MDILESHYKQNLTGSEAEGIDHSASAPSRIAACCGDLALHLNLFSGSDDPKVKALEAKLCMYQDQWTTNSSSGVPAAKVSGALNKMSYFLIRAVDRFQERFAENGLKVLAPPCATKVKSPARGRTLPLPDPVGACDRSETVCSRSHFAMPRPRRGCAQSETVCSRTHSALCVCMFRWCSLRCSRSR